MTPFLKFMYIMTIYENVGSGIGRRLRLDDGNSRKSLDKHGVDQSEAEQVFLDPRLLVLEDDKHSGAEARFHAYGQTATGRLLLVSVTL